MVIFQSLSSHGGHIEITNSWTKITTVKNGWLREGVQHLVNFKSQFNESTEVFLADIATEVFSNTILIFN